MRLNIDCVRDILVTLDENYLIPDSSGFIYPINPTDLISQDPLSKYSQNEILYTIRILFDCNLLLKWKQYIDEDLPRIKDINQEAYTFLDQIKPLSNWEKIKGKLKSSSPVTIPLLIDVAKSLIL